MDFVWFIHVTLHGVREYMMVAAHGWQLWSDPCVHLVSFILRKVPALTAGIDPHIWISIRGMSLHSV